MIPYIRLGDVEVANAARTADYLRAGLHADSRLNPSLSAACDCEAIDDGPYLTPQADAAPWFHSSRPESEEFLGFILDDIDISEPLGRAVRERGGLDGGSILGRLRRRGRVVTVRGFAFASTQRGMDWGRKWLGETLGSESCTFADLRLLPACPPDGDVDPQRYFRTLVRSGVIDGPLFRDVQGVPCHLIQEVTFDLAAEMPWLYRDPENCVTDQALTAGLRTCCQLTNSDWIGDATAVIRIESTAVQSDLEIAWQLNAAECGALSTAEAYWRADTPILGKDALLNDIIASLRDLSGNGHHARLGSASGEDANDPIPLYLDPDDRQYLYLSGVSGNRVTTPDSANLDFKKNMDVRVEIAPHPDWVPAADQCLISKWETVGDQRSWDLYLLSTGAIRFRKSWDGTAANITSLTSPATGFEDEFSNDEGNATFGVKRWIRATFEAFGGGTISIYTSVDGVSWTLVAQNDATAENIHQGTADLIIGAASDGAGGYQDHFEGKVWQAQVKGSDNGSSVEFTTLRLDADFTDRARLVEPFSTFNEKAFNATMTISRSASGLKAAVVDRDMLLLGTDRFLEVPDDAGLDFAAADSFTLITLYRVYGTTTGQVIMAKRAGLAATDTGYSLARGSTANIAEFEIADGTNEGSDAISSALDEGTLTCVAGRRDVVADEIEAFKDGTGSGSPTTDPTTATLANAEVLRIGRLSGAGTSYGDFEFVAGALFREALSDAEIAAACDELVGGADVVVGLTVETLGADEAVVIDGQRRQVYVEDADGTRVRGLDVIDFSGVFDWPDFGPSETLCVCAIAEAAGATLTVDGVEREV